MHSKENDLATIYVQLATVKKGEKMCLERKVILWIVISYNLLI